MCIYQLWYFRKSHSRPVSHIAKPRLSDQVARRYHLCYNGHLHAVHSSHTLHPEVWNHSIHPLALASGGPVSAVTTEGVGREPSPVSRRTIALDPGVRTFQTGFDPEGVCVEWGVTGYRTDLSTLPCSGQVAIQDRYGRTSQTLGQETCCS